MEANTGAADCNPPAANSKPAGEFAVWARLTSPRSVRTFLRLAYADHLAQVAELVDALVSGTSGAIRGGSSPLLGTTPPPLIVMPIYRVQEPRLGGLHIRE